MTPRPRSSEGSPTPAGSSAPATRSAARGGRPAPRRGRCSITSSTSASTARPASWASTSAAARCSPTFPARRRTSRSRRGRRTDEALVSVAELLRRYHDAVASFDPAPHAWPGPVPAAYRGALVAHNDPNLDNVVFDWRPRRRAARLRPRRARACAAWDFACAARLWAPLRDPRDLPEAVGGRSLERLRLFAGAYGLSRGRRAPSRRPRCSTRTTGATPSCATAVAERARDLRAHVERGRRAPAERTQNWLAGHRDDVRASASVPH